MPRQATIRYVSLRNSLMNLPLSLYAPLVKHRVRAQGVAVYLSETVTGQNVSAHVGWTGLAAASSLARLGQERTTVEIYPQYAASQGFPEGTLVEIGLLHDSPVASKHVATEPCPADDWEIIELHAKL